MKTITILLIGILTLSLVVAGTITLTNSNSIFTPTKDTAITNTSQITFTCGKTPKTIYLKEYGNIDDDFEKQAGLICNEQITNAVYNGKKYQTNSYGLRSFDTDKLNEDSCHHQGLSYNTETNQCYKREVVIKQVRWSNILK